MTWRPKLRWVLVAGFAALLCLPVAGLGALRIYQHELIHRAEAELVSQGSLVQATFKQLLLDELHRERTPESDAPPPAISEYGVPGDIKWRKKIKKWLKPEPLRLGIYPVDAQPKPPKARKPTEPPDPIALRAGERLEPQLGDANRLNRATVHVFDYRGTIVASTDDGKGKSLLHRDEVSKALHGKFVQVLRSSSTRPNNSDSGPHPDGAGVDVCIAMPIVHQGRLLGAVLLAKSPLRVTTGLGKYPTLAWGALALILLGFFGVCALVRYFIDRPVSELVAQTEDVASRGSSAPIDAPRTDEFARVSETLADLAPEEDQTDES